MMAAAANLLLQLKMSSSPLHQPQEGGTAAKTPQSFPQFASVKLESCEQCRKEHERKSKLRSTSTVPSDEEPEIPECKHAILSSSAEEDKRKQDFVAKHGPCEAQPLPRVSPATVENWLTTRCAAIIDANIHHCRHPTCFKYYERERKRNKKLARACRFKYPQPLVDQTRFTEAEEFEMRRWSHRVNNYNRPMLACLNVNHDIRPMWGSGVAVMATVHYATNYATKLQNRLLDKFPVLQARVAIYKEKRQAGFYRGRSAEQEHTSLLSSILLALAGQTELSLPTVVNHLLQQPECIHSDKFEKLVLYPFLEWVDESDEERGLPLSWEEEIGARRPGEFLTVGKKGALHAQRLDYVYRPAEFAGMSLYDFVQFTEKLRRGFGEAVSTYDDHVRYSFLAEHPSAHHTHCARLRHWQERVIPLYVGPYIPSGTR